MHVHASLYNIHVAWVSFRFCLFILKDDLEVPSHCVTSDGSDVTTGSVFTVNVPAVEVAEGVHVPETTTR